MPLFAVTRRAWTRIICLAGAGLLLGGCSMFKSKYADVSCPSTGIVSELGTVTRYRGPARTYPELAYRASLGDVKGSCTIDANGFTIDVSVSTLAEIGPAAPDRSAEFPYFIAVTDPGDKVVAKQVFSNRIAFGPNQSRAGAVDTLSGRIPLADPKDASLYHIVIGFQLTPEELKLNRSAQGV